MLNESQTTFVTLISMISAATGIATGMMQLIGERAKREREKQRLELLKLKCEIEVLRRGSNLDLPPLLGPQDIDSLQDRPRTSMLDPVRLRKSFWYGTIGERPRFALIHFIGLGILGLWCTGGAISLLIIILTENQPAATLAMLLAIFVVDTALGPMFIRSSVQSFCIYKLLIGNRETRKS
jgi:hypothetical protein